MRETFLKSESMLSDSTNFCFVGVNFCSADYLLGVEKAASAIRTLSLRYANADGSSYPLKVYSPEEGYILSDARICDLGDVYGSDNKKLEESLSKLHFGESIPVFVGGDHSVTYELFKRATLNKRKVVVIQFDAHSDFIDEYDEYPHGSVMCQLSKLLPVEKIVHFGIRGNLNCGPALEASRDKGNHIIPYVRIKENMENLLTFLKDKEIYITFDTDFLNPIYAPATNCPEPGGPSYKDAVEYLKDIIQACKKVVGIDFVEYNPTCEGAIITGTTIVNLIMETISFISKHTTS